MAVLDVTPTEFGAFGRVFDITTTAADLTDAIFTGPFKLMQVFAHPDDPESSNFDLTVYCAPINSPGNFLVVENIKGNRIFKGDGFASDVPLLFSSLTGDTPFQAPYIQFTTGSSENRRFYLVCFY